MSLSILIPARNEEFLGRTIKDILSKIEGDTDIIAVLDGQWTDPVIEDHPKVTLLYHPVSVGQRAATNEAAKLSKAKYVMKCDAHCSFGQGFDRIMMEDMEDDITMVPLMKNLHAFDWVCQKCGHRMYQGPTPVEGCPAEVDDKTCGGKMEREMIWKGKRSPNSTAMRFDKNLKFQYWGGYKKQQQGDLVETMSLLGACWMLTREAYFELNICDEKHGSWGQQGTEVACKTWLAKRRLLCNKRTWFAHMFRTQGGDFGFPYKISGNSVSRARKYSQRMWKAEDPAQMPDWDKAVYPLAWLLEKFAPVPDWHDGPEEAEAGQEEPIEPIKEHENLPERQEGAVKTVEPSRGIVYYTDNRLDARIAKSAQTFIERSGLPIVSVSLAPMMFGRNIVLDAERGYLTMFQQILAGLEASSSDIIFFCEHDVFYHPTHFKFVPARKDIFYYNQNSWRVDATGKALFYLASSTSGLCAYRELLLEHYRKRVDLVKANGYTRNMGFEPGTHGREQRVDDYKAEVWMSELPNIDIRHDKNLTRTRWEKAQFRNQRFTKGWTEGAVEAIPGWASWVRDEATLLDLSAICPA